jgi:hypothetical protein
VARPTAVAVSAGLAERIVGRSNNIRLIPNSASARPQLAAVLESLEAISGIQDGLINP